MLAPVQAAVPAGAQLVRVGVEAAGLYHRPLTMAGVWPEGWQVVEVNPAHSSAQRQANGQRGVKTDRGSGLPGDGGGWLAGGIAARHEVGAHDGAVVARRWRPDAGRHLRRNRRGRYGVGSGKDPPNMSELPKVAGQSCSGAGGAGTVVPFCTAACAAARHASMAGQSAA
jgi:hypothetical protein